METYDSDDAADRLRDHAAHPLRARREASDEERSRPVAGGQTAPPHGEQDPEASRQKRPPGGAPRRPGRVHPVAEARRHHDGDRHQCPGGPDRRHRLLRARQRLRHRELLHREEQLDQDQSGRLWSPGPRHPVRDDPPPPRRRRPGRMEGEPALGDRSEGIDRMADDKTIEKLAGQDYRYGFVTSIEEERVPKGLTEETIRLISSKKNEPSWLLDWRLKAFRHWLTMKEPTWANVHYPKIDYQDAYYYSAPKLKKKPKSLDEIDPEIRATYEKLGIPLKEQEMLLGVEGADPVAGAPANIAVDAVFDSVSVATTYKAKLREKGVLFCSFSDAVQEHPDLVRRYVGSVVPYTDNFFATLNSAVFTDGSFCFIPRGVKCPMELSTYFRINAKETGQFERTLIIAEEGASVSYLEGCTAPQRDENQLHAAVVELVALENATIKYSTVQNWYPGDKNGKGGIYNFVTKRGHCKGANSRITWTQVETGSAITWKYPSCILQGDNSIGEFYSVAVANHHQQADTGTKMIHLGKNTRSTIISKGISAGHGQNTYRGAVKILQRAEGARNYSQCDSLLLGDQCGAHTFPYLDVQNPTAQVEHEASTSKIGEDQLFYCKQRGLSTEDAVNMIVNGFCKQVFKELPMEFAVEAQKLMNVSLEGSVG